MVSNKFDKEKIEVSAKTRELIELLVTWQNLKKSIDGLSKDHYTPNSTDRKAVENSVLNLDYLFELAFELQTLDCVKKSGGGQI